MAKKTLKRKNTTREVEKPSSIFFADYSHSKPKHITPVARPMFLAPEYDANAVLRTAGTNVMDVKLTPEEEKKLKKIFKKIDYSKITDKGQIIDTAIDQILGAEDDPNKRNQLQTLLRMTNYMENKYGASDDAWNNKKTNFGFVELDKVAIDDLFTPKGDKGNFTKGQKNNFEYLKNFGLPTNQADLEKLLLDNDPLANMAVSRLVYATNPKPLPNMSDQKAVFNYWLNDYNHRGALKHQTEEDLFNIFQEGYKTYNSPSYKPNIHIDSEGHAVIDDNMGQWAYPGEVTRIASNDITMQGVPYPVLGVGADGEQQMMHPEQEYTFNEAPVTEYPIMEAKDGGWLHKYQEGGWQPNQEDLRADGTQKGTGYLGVLNRPDGGVSSELSMGVEINGQEVEIPTMVPTLNPEEINYLLNTPADEDLMRTEIGKRIMDKAYNHAMMRMDQGLSPFYQEGEERQDTGVPRKQNIFNTKYKRGGVTWLNEYANGGFNLTSPEYAEYEYLQSLNQPVTVVRQPAVGQYQMAQQVNDPSYSNRAYSNKTAVQSAKNAIEAAMPKQMTIDFSQAAVIEEPKEIIVKPTTTSTISTDESQANKVSDKLMSAFQKSADEYKQKYPNRPSPVISSGFRSREKQEQLYANRGNNPYPVAKPGTSKHEHGLAIDVGFTGAHTDQDYANFAAIMNKNGVNWLGARDKVHFELNESAYGGWLDQYAQGGKTFSAGGEKHKVYRKESPTGNGEGVKGHIMVTHPTMDKGEWDTIDLTEKSGARTVAEGIAATRKWHEENPEYANGGGVNLNSPEYAEYQYFQSLNTPSPVYRQPAVETVQIPNTQLQYNTPYNYQRTVDTSYAKDAIEKAMPKQIEIDFGAAAEPVITPSEQKATKQKSESVASTGNLSMEEGTRRAYSAIVRELENDPATKDRAKDIAKMVMAQAAFETGNWKNAAALQANNYSGIKFYGQKGKKPSEVLAPGEEENGYRRPYVQYDSPEDWASGMVELLKGRYKKALETTTPEEYAARLKERGYYGGKESDYAKGLRYYLNNLKFEDKAEHGGWLTKYK